MTKKDFAPVIFWVLAPLAALQDRLYSPFSAEAFMMMGLFGSLGLVFCAICAKVRLTRLGMLVSLLLFAAMVMPMPRILTPFMIVAILCLGWLVAKRVGDAFLHVTLAFAALFTVSGAISNASKTSDFAFQPATQTDHITPDLQTAYVHLVLDELGSPEASRADIPPNHPAHTFLDRLRARGLTVYPTVRSNFSKTNMSLGDLVATSPSQDMSTNWSPNPRPEFFYRISENGLFDALITNGYSMTVFQSTYLDFCDEPPRLTCSTASHYDMRIFANHPIATRGAVALRGISATYMNPVNDRYWPAFRRIWYKMDTPFAVSNILASSVSAFDQWSEIVADIESIQPGEAIFAHVLLPHFPHVYDQQCVEKPVSQWGYLKSAQPSVSDEDLHRRYWDQFECIASQVLAVIDNIQSTKPYVRFVIHGDHGQRLFLDVEGEENPSDLQDTMVITNATHAPSADGRDEPPNMQALVQEIMYNALKQ